MNAYLLGACVVFGLLGGEPPTDEQKEIQRLQGVVQRLYQEKVTLRKQLKRDKAVLRRQLEHDNTVLREQLKSAQIEIERLEEAREDAEQATRMSKRALHSARRENKSLNQGLQEELASLRAELEKAKNAPLPEEASSLFGAFVFQFQSRMQMAPGIEHEVAERVMVLMHETMLDWSRGSQKRTTFCRVAKRKIAPAVKAHEERIAQYFAILDAEVAAGPDALEAVLTHLDDARAATCRARYIGTDVRWKGTIKKRSGFFDKGDWVVNCDGIDVFVSLSEASAVAEVGQTVVIKGKIADISPIRSLEVHLDDCVLEWNEATSHG